MAVSVAAGELLPGSPVVSIVGIGLVVAGGELPEGVIGLAVAGAGLMPIGREMLLDGVGAGFDPSELLVGIASPFAGLAQAVRTRPTSPASSNWRQSAEFKLNLRFIGLL